MNDTIRENQVKRGCFYTAFLVLSFMLTIFLAIFSGVGIFATALGGEFNFLYFISFFIVFAACLFAFYYYRGTFKMKKQSAKRLMIPICLLMISCLVICFYKTPENDSAKAGAGWALLFSFIYMLTIIMTGINSKKMR